MRLIALIRTGVVGGAVLECLVFGGFGAYTLWLAITITGRQDGIANDLNFLAAAALLALAAGFGFGAFLMGSRRVEERIVGGRVMGAVFHLIAAAIAAWGVLWFGVAEMNVDPNTDGYWSPWIAFAVAAAVIVIGLAVLASLFLPSGRDGNAGRETHV